MLCLPDKKRTYQINDDLQKADDPKQTYSTSIVFKLIAGSCPHERNPYFLYQVPCSGI